MGRNGHSGLPGGLAGVGQLRIRSSFQLLVRGQIPVPRRIVGLAIGVVSFIGYMPDVLLPLYDGFLSRHYPRAVSFQIYFVSIALCDVNVAVS